MVVYPALREANEAVDADQLEGEHGYIKTFIYELNEMGPDAPNWLEKVREFRQLVAEHAHMEEERGLPEIQAGHDEGAEREDHEPREPRRLLDGLSLADESELGRFLNRKVDAALSADALDAGSKLGVERIVAACDDDRFTARRERHDEADEAVASRAPEQARGRSAPAIAPSGRRTVICSRVRLARSAKG